MIIFATQAVALQVHPALALPGRVHLAVAANFTCTGGGTSKQAPEAAAGSARQLAEPSCHGVNVWMLASLRPTGDDLQPNNKRNT